uniref:RGS domain-containing protein n=1 Tax=Panagrellus redivivus TaxID=6233 RepID=A0A7E4WAF4_PANRE
MSKITNGLLRKLNKKKDDILRRENENTDSVDSSACATTTAADGAIQSASYTECHIVESLDDVFQNGNAQLYFIQYMEDIGELHLVKFYLHVESFKASFKSTTANDSAFNELIKTDACNIYSQYICADAPFTLGFTDEVRKKVIESMCQATGQIEESCFDVAQCLVRERLENRHFKEFLISVFFSKYLYEIYTSGLLTIMDILKTLNVLCAFLEFLENEQDSRGRNLLEFIISIRDAEQSNVTEEETLIEDAMIIYDKYFSMQATNSLQFSDAIRIEVESKICTENGVPDPSAFERPFALACQILQENHIPAFTRSGTFQKLIEQLAKSIDHHVETPHRDYASGYTSSDPSITPRSPSIQLPPSSPSWITGLKSIRSRALSLDRPPTATRSADGNVSEGGCDDTASQCSASSAFGGHKQRKLNGSLARVDELGRYTPLFNKDVCIDDQPGRGRLRTAIDKYISQSASKEKEKADELAKLIISDIQDMVSIGNSIRK